MLKASYPPSHSLSGLAQWHYMREEGCYIIHCKIPFALPHLFPFFFPFIQEIDSSVAPRIALPHAGAVR